MTYSWDQTAAINNEKGDTGYFVVNDDCTANKKLDYDTKKLKYIIDFITKK